MSIEREKFYPGDDATALQVLELADEYRKAALALLATGRPGKPLSRAPFRMVAIHAIELYLNALMLSRGLPAAKVRGLQHNMAPRTLFARTSLSLRQDTISHLFAISESREYLVSRYGAEAPSSLSQLNRLEATLNEVGDKVRRTVEAEAA
jgi:hypothetical protein